MDQQTDPISQSLPPVFRTWGIWAVLAGAIALCIVVLQVSGAFLNPQPSTATQIGEIAGEIKRSAWRSFFGIAQPEPEVVTTSLRDWVTRVGPVLGAAAIVLSVISGVRGENWRFVVYGTGLGATAILFHFFWWMALLVVGAMLLITIIENIGDIFSF